MPVRARKYPQQQARTENHTDAIGTDLDAIADAEFLRVEQAYGKRVSDDVLRRCQRVERKCSHENDAEVLRQVQLRQQQCARH